MSLKSCCSRCLYLSWFKTKLCLHTLRIHRPLIMSVLCLYATTFLFVLPLLCKHLPFSYYYGGDTDLMKIRAADLNKVRISHAKEYLAKLDPKVSLKVHKQLVKSTNLSIIIGIITTQRPSGHTPPYYLTQVAVKMDHLIKDTVGLYQHFQNKAFFICNVDNKLHREAETLSGYFPMIKRYNKEKGLPSSSDFKFEKEKQDYEFCLRKALSFNSSFILLLEDDAVPREDLFVVLSRMLSSPNLKPTSDSIFDWAFLKLFYPEKWRGYENDMQSVFELGAIGILGGFSLSSLVVIVKKAMKKRTGVSVNILAIIFLFGTVYSILLAIFVGRQYWINWRRVSTSTYSLSRARGCCTQATLFPVSTAQTFVKLLNKTASSSKNPVDIALDSLAKQHQYKTYAIEPNLIHHIGMVSVMQNAVRKPGEFL